MSLDTRVPSAELTGVYGGLVKMIARRMMGRVPDSAGVLWNQPAVFKDVMSFGRKTDKWDQLDANLASLATMAAAATVGCDFCLDFGYFMAHNKGLDESKAREVPRWRDSDAFTAIERAVLGYAEAMSHTPPQVTDEMSATLLDQLGAPALVELTMRVGGMNLTARGNLALGVGSQQFAESCGLPPLATRSAT